MSATFCATALPAQLAPDQRSAGFVRTFERRVIDLGVPIEQRPLPPDCIDTVAVAGGYDAVVQFSGASSLARLHRSSDAQPLVAVVSREDLRAFLTGESLPSEPTLSSEPAADTVVVEAAFEPVALEYRRDGMAAVTYRLIVSVSDAEFARPPSGIAAAAPFALGTPAGASSLPAAYVVGTGQITFAMPLRIWSWELWEHRFRVTRGEGISEVSISFPDGYARVLFDRYLAEAATPARIDARFRSDDGLTPWVLLSGPPSSYRSGGINALTPRIVGTGGGAFSAVALCFAFPETTTADPASVAYFLAGQDYGYVANERMLAAFWAFRWHVGTQMATLHREFAIQGPAVIRIGEEDRDAIVEGVLRLDSLDTIALSTVANERGDRLLLGGRARVYPTMVRVSGASYVQIRESVDLGSTLGQWGVAVELALDGVDDARPEVKLFQEDAGRFLGWLARPFLHPEDAEIHYLRVDGVFKTAFFLGALDAEGR